MDSYFENPAVSQSSLKLLAVDPTLFNSVREPEMYFEEKKHFIIGSAVDFCLTQPDRDFSEVYHLSELENKPSDTIKSIINQLFDAVVEQFDIEEIGNITSPEFKLLILQCCDSHKYQNNWYEQTRINKICEHYEYWEDLKTAYGKTILSQDEKNLIDSIVMSLRTSESTSKYFNESNVRYQMPIYFEYDGVDCKALLDMVIIDESKKEVQPIDIKTIGDYTINFPKSLRRRRYDIQAAWYTEALKCAYPDYKILPFKFIVESTVHVGTPLVYTLDNTLLEMGRSGRPELYLTANLNSNGYFGLYNKYYQRLQEIKGFVQLVELYKYYNTNGFDVDQRVRESNSELIVDWSGII